MVTTVENIAPQPLPLKQPEKPVEVSKTESVQVQEKKSPVSSSSKTDVEKYAGKMVVTVKDGKENVIAEIPSKVAAAYQEQLSNDLRKQQITRQHNAKA